MLRDLRLFRRNPPKIPPSTTDHSENLQSDPPESSTSHPDVDPSRPPLHSIQEPLQNPRSGLAHQPALKRKLERTPSKPLTRGSDAGLPLCTPEKRGKFGWVPKGEHTTSSESADGSSYQGPSHLPPPGRGLFGITTPRIHRMSGKASSVHSDSSSTQSTPTKSVSKPMHSGFSGSSRPHVLGSRGASFSAAMKGLPMLSMPPSSTLNVAGVPHFELKEDPSFWLDHNVQVVIRVRPLSSTERNSQGYGRCLKQESAQSITWIGQPETRFMFDYVACETIDQEMLFRVAGLPMVENCLSGYNSCMFAYGQTGSGKTYTMLGEIGELEFRPCPDRGMTPRIFEFLFARIRAEEESRLDEKLKYSCKCSFLEIYNEQVADLLDPSSTNLLLREDQRQGVYVENLTEFEVENVNDILRLLIQGAANRKVAATNMNHESSRSHSVFTCVIESRWEQDCTTNLRFARLNLVDLAGSERQKTSGAEGERLKEAANINKSLSTLGHVIMLLADAAHGKQKHVPYRDSRLTFLLQDSLGGNSKTIIMANVSPSICSANETLSTLKFAQRARLIQNNAVVNEDSSGDVVALQHQIHLLKEELSVFKCQNISRSLSFRATIFEDSAHEKFNSSSGELHQEVGMNDDEFHKNEASCSIRVSTKQLKSLEAILAGALRREKMADITIKQLEAEIEQLNRLVRQREEDTRSSKMMLKFREDKILKMEALLDGLIPTDTYLMEENTAISEEIQLLRMKVDRNPEVTRFALENIRLLDQLRRFQDFYEEGERELLLAEISELRNQLLQFLDRKPEQNQYLKSEMVPQDVGHSHSADSIRERESMCMELEKTHKELENCRNNLSSCLETNAKLTREINSLRIELNSTQAPFCDSKATAQPWNVDLCLASLRRDPQFQDIKLEQASEYTTTYDEENLNLQLELDILKTIIVEEKSSRAEIEEKAIRSHHDLKVANEKVLHISKQNENLINELRDVRSITDALESQHIMSLNELEDLRENNSKYVELLNKYEQDVWILRKQLGLQSEGGEKLSFAHEEVENRQFRRVDFEGSPLQVKLKRMQVSIEKACSLNLKYQNDQKSQISIAQEIDEVHEQVEAETAEVIVCLQEELMTLQQVEDSNRKELLAKDRLMTLEVESKELHERLFLLAQENERLGEKENGIRSLAEDWERLACEIADALAGGDVSLQDAYHQVASISESFPHMSWVSEKVQNMVTGIADRDALIKELRICLEDAEKVKCDMERKLRSLRGATLAITEAHQLEINEKEKRLLLLGSQISEKNSVIMDLESKIKLDEESLKKAEICATVAFMTVGRLSEINKSHLQALENVKLMRHAPTDRGLLRELHCEQFQGHCSQLKYAHEQQQSHALEKEDEYTSSTMTEELLKAMRAVSEIKNGVCSLRSFMNEYVEQDSKCTQLQNSAIGSSESSGSCFEVLVEIKSTQNVISDWHQNIRDLPGSTIYSPVVKEADEYLCTKSPEVICNRESILLLRIEIESTLVSLREVQGEMANLLKEKEGLKNSEIQSQKAVHHLSSELLQLKSAIDDKEKKFELRLLELNHKLLTIEENDAASDAYWRNAKEVLEHEIDDAKAVAAQRTAEMCNLIKKIEEAQKTMEDADIMIKALVHANEASQLKNEYLVCKVDHLKTSLDMKEQEYMHIQNNLCSNHKEVSSLVSALGDSFRHLEATFTEKVELVACDLDWVKHQLHRYIELARTWLEETWSEIIGKDCAVSVLHVCHMGILLERLTGLNAENNFLHRGLCESNSVIVDLRERNDRARKELEMCSLLKGKLLFDINNNFNRISKKEDEAEEFKAKLNSFGNRILFLQSQEESMVARSNFMSTELTSLMKEFDATNGNASTGALIKEKLLKENEDLQKHLQETSRTLEFEKLICRKFQDSVFQELDWVLVKSSTDTSIADSHVTINETDSCTAGPRKEPEQDRLLIECRIESIMTNVFAKDIELLVLTSELKYKIAKVKHIASRMVSLERQRGITNKVTEKLKEDVILQQVYGELKNHELCALLVENEMLNFDLSRLKEDHSIIYEDLQEAKVGFASALNHVDLTNKQNCNLEEITHSLTASVASLKTDVERKNAELEAIHCSHTVISKELALKNELNEIQAVRINTLESENASVKNEMIAFSQKKAEAISMLSLRINHCFDLVQSVNIALDRISHLTNDQIDLLMNTHGQEISRNREVTSKVVDGLESLALTAKEMMYEKFSLQTELIHKDEALKGLLFDLNLLQESVSVAMGQNNKFEELAARLESLEGEHSLKTCELDKAVVHEQLLETQLLEKDRRISALESANAEKDTTLDHFTTESFGLRTHIEEILEAKSAIEQESKEKIKVTESLEKEILAMSSLITESNHFLEDMLNKLALKTCELDKAVVYAQLLETQLLEKDSKISALESENADKGVKLDLFTTESSEFRAHVEEILKAKSTFEQELKEKIKVNESLEKEILAMSSLIAESDLVLEDIRNDMAILTDERDRLDSSVLVLKEQLEIAHALAEENEAIATEARQIAEERKIYAEDKEEEVRLLERSVEELECTINALENKVKFIKGEAERQRLQREELELELGAVRSQMLAVPSSGNLWNATKGGVDFSRNLKEKVTELQEVQQTIQILQEEIKDKDAEILRCRSHISELNMHSEAQAREYKQKFKELEAMAQQVKSEPTSSNGTSLTSTKAEKGAIKSRGSGSPFKCIGLGLSQQVNSEKDEELAAARRRIEELETVAVGRQKEIFMLNTRLAAAESMTHDVIRDLLGVKLDMANYATLLDHQQGLNEKALAHSDSHDSNGEEVDKLKQQLNEFIEERQSWLDEVSHRQTELVTARIVSEKLRQREQFLTTENALLKADIVKHKNIVTELENEVDRLSSHQNLQQRIHHHAKIKEENCLLKNQKEELSAKLQRSEVLLCRMREELACYRASSGRKAYFDIDEEEHLRKKLDEIEEERIKLAQNLRSLCTRILKVARLPLVDSSITPSSAEDALDQIEDQINILENELQDSKLQCRISCEKLRLSELKQRCISLTEDDCTLQSTSNYDGNSS